jgi:predicted aspartyl protease
MRALVYNARRGMAMGMFQVQVTVSPTADATKSFTELFWVDTGAYHTCVPEDRLAAIGVTPVRTREFVLADGRRDRRLIGEVRLHIETLAEQATCQVVFGPPGSLYLLGASALEAFTVGLDPLAQKLTPIAVVIACSSAIV